MPRPLVEHAYIERVAKTLGATQDGLTNGEIQNVFRALKITNRSGHSTKWKIVHDVLCTEQDRRKNGDIVWAFVEECVKPVRYIDRPDVLLLRTSKLNEDLALAGLSIGPDGKLVEGVAAVTLEEAAERADRLLTELKRRRVHDQVLVYCQREVLQKDLFHAVHEATKGIFERLRKGTHEVSDGGELVDVCFRDRDGLPMIVINDYETETDKSEHRGFANLLRGAYGFWRNPTAHSVRIEVELVELDVLDALTTIGYIHRVLDRAEFTDTGDSI